jgi:metal-dependent hydrolase (beta-lactamase superfamily II)
MNIDANELDTIIISHDHYDHCHALPEFIEKYHPNKIYVPSDFSSFKSPNIIKINDRFRK